jgi:hypothetical protein
MRVENKIKADLVGRFVSISSNNLAKDRPPAPPMINANGRYLGSINLRNSALTNTKKKGNINAKEYGQEYKYGQLFRSGTFHNFKINNAINK